MLNFHFVTYSVLMSVLVSTVFLERIDTIRLKVTDLEISILWIPIRNGKYI